MCPLGQPPLWYKRQCGIVVAIVTKSLRRDSETQRACVLTTRVGAEKLERTRCSTRPAWSYPAISQTAFSFWIFGPLTVNKSILTKIASEQESGLTPRRFLDWATALLCR